MKPRTILFVAAAAAVLAPGWTCAEGDMVDLPSDTTQLSEHEIETVLSADYTGIHDRQRVVLRSQEEWEDFWTRAHGIIIPTPPVPAVDFSQRMVVVAAMGSRSTGGHSIHIDSVHRDGADYYVEVREVRPGTGCIVTQAFTAPVDAVAVPRTDGDVSFVESEARLDC